MIDYAVLTAKELTDIMFNMVGLGIAIGLLAGIFVCTFFIYAMEHANMRNFKMYLYGLDEEARKDVLARFEAVKLETDELSMKTNLRMFKSMYNMLSEVKAFLERKWMQN